MTTRNTKALETRTPDFIASHVAERNGKSFWTRIGAAWTHEDGNGLTLRLDLIPVAGGQIVLRMPKSTEEEAA